MQNPAETKFPGIFSTGGNYPIKGTTTLVQITRYLRGNLVTYNLNDIASIIPYKGNRPGGKITFNNGATDFYYKAWPLTIEIIPN